MRRGGRESSSASPDTGAKAACGGCDGGGGFYLVPGLKFALLRLTSAPLAASTAIIKNASYLGQKQNTPESRNRISHYCAKLNSPKWLHSVLNPNDDSWKTQKLLPLMQFWISFGECAIVIRRKGAATSSLAVVGWKAALNAVHLALPPVL